MGPHVEFSGETFFPLCETFLPAGSGLNSKIHMAVMKEAQPAFDPAQRGCGSRYPPQDAVQKPPLSLSLQGTVLLTRNPLPAYSPLLYLNLWKLIFACFLGIYVNTGDVGSISGLGRSPRQGNGNPHHYSSLFPGPWPEEPGG